ncbi:MAG: HAMP domain-containing sensor histidine kinase [Acidobacteriota bacterium]
MTHDDLQLGVLKLQERLRARLDDVHDPHKALVSTLRSARELFAADGAAVAVRRAGQTLADVFFSLPAEADWDLELLTAYLAEERPTIPSDLLLAPVERRGRNWAVMVLARQRGFESQDLRSLFAIAETATDLVRRLDERRLRRVRRKIEQKIADRQEPKDVIYDILHGLRTLTRYDHSACLYSAAGRGAPLRLVAEQIAWTKARSRRIGQVLELSPETRAELRRGRVRWFHRAPWEADGAEEMESERSAWLPADGGEPSSIPPLLAHHGQNAPPEETLIYAPIAQREGALALLQISARRTGVLDAYEAALVAEFRALVSLAVQFSMRTESLQERILKSERKHVLANLTRGIAHDINNALGAMLPLVQELKVDAAADQLDARRVGADLEVLETSLQTCRRIFRGMLAIARGAREGLGHGNLRRSIDAALSVLEDSLRRRKIAVELDLPDELPLICGNQGDLTQLFLNLCSNARDSMNGGGRLGIRATPGERAVEVEVVDNGEGIPASLRERVLEPFFTTKKDGDGHGLGLAICRSILWDIGGQMHFEDISPHGTRVVLTLPVRDGQPRSQPA